MNRTYSNLERRRIPSAFCALVVLAAIVVFVRSNLWAADAEPVSFVDQVQPLLISKCISCHGAEKQEGGLRLDSLEAAKLGGQQGPAIVPGDVTKSLLVSAVSFRDAALQMPPKQKLSEKEIAALTEWVRAGALWPEPVAVLFEDEPKFLASLTSGNGHGRIVTDDHHSGQAALGITPLQRENAKIPHWNFPIREKPGVGEYRFLRLAWRKRGGGSILLEIAQNGHWPDAKAPQGRYVAGPNTTGWAAISVADDAPMEWMVVTFDLWKDIGAFTFTGCAPTCDGGEEAFFDALLLGPTLASLDAYRPGSPLARIPGRATPSTENIGDAFTDTRNPIRKLFGGERLDLWSLKAPTSSGKSVDELVHSALAREQATLAPAAEPRTLIRRLSFDLLGLPPTYDEVAAFERESQLDADGAYEKLVERFLASPHYGERQARLWLDVVRYADTHGYERDEFRPLIHQYRDYIIRAFIQDKPFDEFVREQLAGDELLLAKRRGEAIRTSDEDLLLATGFLRLGQWDSTAAIFQEEPRLRAEMMADLTNTTASAFLGMTFSCCQCHDHKYDPLTQADHFRLRAFFAAVTDQNDAVISPAEELADIQRRNDELDRQAEPLRKERAAILDTARESVAKDRRAKLPEEIRNALAIDPAQRDEATKEKLQPVLEMLKVSDDDARAALEESAKARESQLAEQIAVLDGRKQEPRRAMTAHDSGPTAPDTPILYQGDFSAPRDVVDPGFPSLFAPGPAEIVAPDPSTTGRRLALANWIASAKNPWTARVIVNRIWQQHFGTGLVATPNDFGYSGARPSQQELLDTLAVDFVRNGWSIKHLHRTILNSATYRQRATFQHETSAVRQSVRRLDAETLRDSILAVSGLLKARAGGKPLWPPVPEELLHAQPAILEAEKGGDGGRMQGWYADPIEETDVRSVFLVRKRCLPIPFLQVFDLPDTTVSCARRDTTVVAPQALMLLNSSEAIRYATAFAERLAAQEQSLDFDDSSRTARLVERLFQQALSRAPSDEERLLALQLLRRHKSEYRKELDVNEASSKALADLCRGVFNLNEFAFVD